MLFNSPEFLVFILCFFILWPLIKSHQNLKWTYLVISSFFFYGWWDYRFIFLILASGLLDFFCGQWIVRFPHKKRWLLALSIFGNIGSLAIFKYTGFAVSNINWALVAFGSTYSVAVPNIILPIGISFYTFQSMSYTIDIYRGNLEPTPNILHFFSYLVLFPQLVAGPIVRASHLLPQLVRSDSPTHEQRFDGLYLISLGYFKKVVLADNFAPFINAAFSADHPAGSGLFWWIVMTAFSFQIYCDFSGYTDIARGLARWMGYEFELNFNRPYLSGSIRDFWARWHISLSSWFRDYVYFPLGGSQKGKIRAHVNLWITMLISGLWHGAAWTFLFWGALHAAYLSLERITRWPDRLMKFKTGHFLSVLVVFLMVLLAWVFFRATSFSQAIRIVRIMFDFTTFGLNQTLHLLDVKTNLAALVFLGFTCGHHGIMMVKNRSFQQASVRRHAAAIVFFIIASIYLRGPGSSFIYFQF